MGGDFNFIQDTVYDSDGGSPTLKMSSITELSQLKNSRDLLDIWHIRNPFTKRFTYRQHNPLIQRRLDYFLISDSLQDHTKYVDINPAINTDHSAIVLKFSYIKQTERGPSYWKFNNSLLSDNVYLNMMRGKMDEFISANHLPDDPRSSWDFLKFKIKELTRKYSAEKKAAENKTRLDLESKLKTLVNSLSTNPSENLLKEYEECKSRLKSLYDHITNGLIIRSKVSWYEKGEKSNKYFYNVEKRNKSKSHVKSLIIDNNIIVHDQAFVMKQLKTFYSSLYSRKSVKTEKECFDYLADINTPALSEDDQTLCDGQITLNEIFGALNNMASNKTPGNDGPSKEFYLAFFDLLGPKLLECLNKVFSLGEFSISQRQAVVTLVEKKGRDK